MLVYTNEWRNDYATNNLPVEHEIQTRECIVSASFSQLRDERIEFAKLRTLNLSTLTSCIQTLKPLYSYRKLLFESSDFGVPPRRDEKGIPWKSEAAPQL
jgi:hypothetical protein